jgi:hypothetical protein
LPERSTDENTSHLKLSQEFACKSLPSNDPLKRHPLQENFFAVKRLFEAPIAY